MDGFKNDQEEFWAGSFGDEYAARNQGSNLISLNTAFFAKIMGHTTGVHSVIEFGANIGMNLQAIRPLFPEAELSAIEINQQAVSELRKMDDVKIYAQSILDFTPDYERDFVLIKGVLIHMNPESLPHIYQLLYRSSKRYICLAEYYNPKPVEVLYRGHSGKLFKRDFAGEMLDTFKDLGLVAYGFVYHRDNNFPQDDITWFLLEKRPQ